MATMKPKLVIKAKEVVQITQTGAQSRLIGDQMKDLKVLRENPAGYCIAIGSDGKIIAVDTIEQMTQFVNDCENTIDATGMVVLPGLIDAHTHPVWAGDRVHEFSMKLSGASYMDIHKAGGGINFTVTKTRQATEAELLQSLLDRLKWMLKCGTTTIEAKSGYGLDTEHEIKMLTVLNQASKKQPIEISPTYCGAHAVPQGKTAEEATLDIIEVQLPSIKSAIDKGTLKVENIDAFCETGVFNVEQTEKILHTGKMKGLTVNFHGDELSHIGAAELGAKLKAAAVSHLEHISSKGIARMSQSATMAVLLPTTAFMLRLKPPPVRAMIEAKVPIALGSDFNPNAYCYSMPMVMHLACVLFHMTLEEALVASTINAAASLGRGLTHGAIHVGRCADLIIIDAPKWEHLIYQFGCNESLIKHVIKNGNIVYSTDK